MITILQSFNIESIGLLTEVKHELNGIPSGSIFQDKQTNDKWIVEKRVFNGELLQESKEVVFENENVFIHLSHGFNNADNRKTNIEKETEKRKGGIYWYILKSRSNIEKPRKGVVLTRI